MNIIFRPVSAPSASSRLLALPLCWAALAFYSIALSGEDVVRVIFHNRL